MWVIYLCICEVGHSPDFTQLTSKPISSLPSFREISLRNHHHFLGIDELTHRCANLLPGQRLYLGLVLLIPAKVSAHIEMFG